MTTDLTTQDQKAIAARDARLMDDEMASARDILIGKILVMQPVSKFIHEEKAKPGELRGSLEGNLIAGKGQAAEFVAFSRYKTRLTFKKVKNKQEYVGQVPWTAAFELEKPKSGPWVEHVGNEEYEHYEVLNFYVLLPKDIADSLSFPYLMSFRSTGYKAGRMLETFRTKLQMHKKTFSSKIFNITSEQTENDKGTFYVPVVTMGRDATEAEQNAADQWKTLILGKNVTVDNSDIETEVANAAPAPEPVDTRGMNMNF